MLYTCSSALISVEEGGGWGEKTGMSGKEEEYRSGGLVLKLTKSGYTMRKEYSENKLVWWKKEEERERRKDSRQCRELCVSTAEGGSVQLVQNHPRCLCRSTPFAVLLFEGLSHILPLLATSHSSMPLFESLCDTSDPSIALCFCPARPV